MHGLRFVSVTLVLVLAAATSGAELTLPNIFGSHMVLQRDAPIPVWGKADPGADVRVALGDAIAHAAADADGMWKTALPQHGAGGPYTLTVESGNEKIVFEDVLMGEVWVCSGQSNMQWTVNASKDADLEKAAANYPEMRMFQVPREVAHTPQFNCGGEWTLISPDTVGDSSAVGYFFGREIHQITGVPVGLLQTNWGGTPSEAWTSREALESEPFFKPLLDRWDKMVEQWPETQGKYKETIAAWEKKVEEAKAAGQTPPRKPGAPMGPDHPHRPANLYNGMIAPVAPYGIRGAIWYQGESNASRAYQYRGLFPCMIWDWRVTWEQGEFPFYFVQLANWRERFDHPTPESDWAELREAQLMTLDVNQTGMAVITDIGEGDDIHPRNKQDVGKRLARWALVDIYGREDIAKSGPLYTGHEIEDGKIVLKFAHTNGGLDAHDGPLRGFMIAGADRKFVWGTAAIQGETVVVSSDEVPDPVSVRYNWADNPDGNLFNKAGLPASPFRTDDWPGITIGNN